MSKRLIVLFAGVLALAIVAGCGSSDDSTDTDTTSVDVTITKEQLIAQGDAICKQGNEEIEEGFESYAEENGIPKNQEPSDEQGVEIVETVLVPNLKTQAELIRGLGAPEGDEEQVEELLDSLDEAVETAEDDPEALFNEDTDPFGDVNQQAQDYGFSECGEE
ncbi:MAG TPA: hypothetical protein VGO66_03855 [Solirubrobacterales bacterium]|nr:hypothetical protein [Solirubrobacterales bacterium]